MAALTTHLPEKRVFGTSETAFVWNRDICLSDVDSKVLAFEIDLKLEKVFDDVFHSFKNVLELFFVSDFEGLLVLKLLLGDIGYASEG